LLTYIQYSSRVASHIAKQRQVHKLRHVVSELVKFMINDGLSWLPDPDIDWRACPYRVARRASLAVA
jgi:Patatin phospholipase